MDNDDDDFIPGAPHTSAFFKAYGKGFQLEIKSYQVNISSINRTIDFSCFTKIALVNELPIAKDEKKIQCLPIHITLQRDPDYAVKNDEAIGYLEYFDAMERDGPVSGAPECAAGLVVVPADSFDTILMLLLRQKDTISLGLRVRGIKSGWPFGPIWNVSKAPRILIAYFVLIVSGQATEESSADDSADDPSAAILRIEQRLTQIEKLIQQGVRIRLFN